MDDEVKYYVINLDVEEDEESWTGIATGPFDEYEEAVDYGNRWMQFFGVGELNKPERDE